MGIIYKLTSPSSKIYVGQTINTFQERLQGHKKICSNCRKLKEAINEYGFENFKKEILWEGPNNELGEMEKYYIKEFNCVYPNGYNLSSGGGRGEERTESTKEIQRKITRENIIKKKGVLGKLEKREKKNGTISHRFYIQKNNKYRVFTFKTEEEAREYQKEYSKDPEKYHNELPEKPNIVGRVRANQWKNKPPTSYSFIYKDKTIANFKTEEEAKEYQKEFSKDE